MAATIAVAVMAGLLGVLVILIGFLPAESRADKPTSRLTDAFYVWRGQFTRQRQMIALGGIALGVVLWLVSGWIVPLFAAPAAAIGIPLLLGRTNDGDRIARLEALEQWMRSLSGLIVGGVSLENAIAASQRSAPTAIAPDITRLSARISARWPTADALQAFADELKDSTADLVVAHLTLAAEQRGPGLAASLEDLAADVFDEVKARRQIEADRAKPRQTIRLITGITLGVLAAIPFAGQFFAPYGTPFGQLLLVGWLVVYVAVLLWMKSMATSRPTPRILDNAGEVA